MKLIDRTEALTLIANEIKKLHREEAIVVGERVEEIGLAKAFDVIYRLPIVEERPKGKWIGYRASNGLICAKCSECKTAYGFLRTPFCPNCGADMRGG